MSAVSGQTTPSPEQEGSGNTPENARLLIDLDSIDLTAVHADAAEIAKWIPHRHEMALLDAIVWTSESAEQGVAVKHVGHDEFWVRGHFPERPMLPGVLMIECGAQLACYLYNIRQDGPKLAAFVRIENAVFRRSVEPGQTLYVICREHKMSKRRFISDIQGVVDGLPVFEARITGVNLTDHFTSR